MLAPKAFFFEIFLFFPTLDCFVRFFDSIVMANQHVFRYAITKTETNHRNQGETMETLYDPDRKANFKELFASPGALYRDTPFWSWNSELDGEELKRQIHIFKEMGMEEPENAELFLDGVKVEFEDNGYWTDRSLRTGFLPRLSAGTHEILVKIAYTRSGNVERCFLLGDFGVELRGDDARIVEPVRELVWGDATSQGLPFYGGNITYHCKFRQYEDQKLLLRIPSRVTNMSSATVPKRW